MSKGGKGLTITAQMMDDLLDAALSGDSGAETLYRDYARRLAHRANEQLRATEREGLTDTSAYVRATRYTSQYDRTRFREGNKSIDLYELSDDVDTLLSYTHSESYSLKRQRMIAEDFVNMKEVLAEAGVDVEDEYIGQQVVEMFRTDAWKDYKKSLGGGTNLIQAAQDAFRAGKSVDDLIAAWEDYSAGRDASADIYNTWERFTGHF